MTGNEPPNFTQQFEHLVKLVMAGCQLNEGDRVRVIRCYGGLFLLASKASRRADLVTQMQIFMHLAVSNWAPACGMNTSDYCEAMCENLAGMLSEMGYRQLTATEAIMHRTAEFSRRAYVGQDRRNWAWRFTAEFSSQDQLLVRVVGAVLDRLGINAPLEEYVNQCVDACGPLNNLWGVFDPNHLAAPRINPNMTHVRDVIGTIDAADQSSHITRLRVYAEDSVYWSAIIPKGRRDLTYCLNYVQSAQRGVGEVPQGYAHPYYLTLVLLLLRLEFDFGNRYWAAPESPSS